MSRKMNYDETSHNFHSFQWNFQRLWHNADDKIRICNNTDNKVSLVEKRKTVDKV